MMKEKLYTIELTDAVKAGDECPFCWLERKLEQESLEFVLGSSYMESDVREQTSEKGFCRHHTKMMYDYGNTLGNAWILKSRMERMNRQFKRLLEQQSIGADGRKTAGAASGGEGRAGGFFGRIFQSQSSSPASGSELEQWLRSEETHCYICGRMDTVYRRVLDTFVYMLRNDQDFTELLMNSRGFCLHHFADVLSVCGGKLKPQEQTEWLPRLGELTGRNLDRIQEDVDWLIEKYDYRNKDADWKNSRDAVQRTMQKLTGGYPADPVFQCRK
ncbi:MAG: DUF6062 family protein [Eubacteriales bacterium]|nr:DUF6062 family protein [Eubacteriales bacterium]